MLTLLSSKRNIFYCFSLLLVLTANRAFAGDSAASRPTKIDWSLVYGQRIAAQKKADNELKRAPESAAWHDYAAWAYSGLPQGLSEASKACDLAPTDNRFLTTLSMVTFLSGDLPAAGKLAMKAAQSQPGNGRALAVVAACCAHDGQAEEAQQLADAAAKAESGDYETNMFLYEMYAKQKNLQKCKETADRLIAACPTSSIAYLLRGKIERDLHQADNALADFQHAHKLDPANAAIATALARSLESVEQHDQAVKSYDSVIKLKKTASVSANLYYRRANSLLAAGRFSEAASDFSDAIKAANQKAPANSFVSTPDGLRRREYKICWVRKAELLEQLGKTNEAMNTAAALLKIDPACDVALQVHQSTARKLGNYRQAIKDLDKLIAMDDDVASWYRSRGEAYAGLHDFKNANADFARAKHLDDYGD